MRRFNSINEIPSDLGPVVLTLGNFDGVHMGHRKLLAEAKVLSEELGAKLMTLTFNPHPLSLISPKDSPKKLFDSMDLEEQLDLLEVDCLWVEPFTERLAGLEAESFLEQYLFSCLDLAGLVVGYDVGFGADRKGGIDLLKNWSERKKFQLKSVEAFLGPNKEICSSSRIRGLVACGDIEMANQLLARPYYVKGVVGSGHGRGAKIGFPTANVYPRKGFVLPSFGVYISSLVVGEKKYCAVSNIGQNPTFGDGDCSVETYVIGEDLDLYGVEVRVEIVKRLRGELKFPGVSELIEQIGKDVQQAKDFYGI